jgi:hypothetical protein
MEGSLFAVGYLLLVDQISACRFAPAESDESEKLSGRRETRNAKQQITNNKEQITRNDHGNTEEKEPGDRGIARQGQDHQ